MRYKQAAKILALVLTSGIVASGCALPQKDSGDVPAQGAEPVDAQSKDRGRIAELPRPLPFKGQLVSGDPDELPPSVALSIAKDAAVTFAYREELSHDEYHIPLIVSAFDPATYVGAPLGDYGVTAFASLTIEDGANILGIYTAKAYVSRSYSLYSEPTHREVERAAKAAVRAKIDHQLEQDREHLLQAFNDAPGSSSSQ